MRCPATSEVMRVCALHTVLTVVCTRSEEHAGIKPSPKPAASRGLVRRLFLSSVSVTLSVCLKM